MADQLEAKWVITMARNTHSKRHTFNRSPSVRGASEGLHFEAMRLFRYSGKKANNPDGFEEALSGFLLSEE